MATSATPYQRRVAALCLVAIVFWTWLPPLQDGLSLDETVTDWVVRGTSFGEMWSRSHEFQVHSWYFVVPWTLGRFSPDLPEWILRAPSLLCAVWMVIAIGRIARFVGGPEAGLWAMVIGASTTVTLHLATEARPYALGLALLTTGMGHFFLWLRRGRLQDGVLCAIATGIAMNVQILLGVVGLLQLGTILFLRHGVRQWRYLLPLAALFTLPAASTALEAFQRRGVYSWAAPPTLGSFLQSLVLFVLPIAVIVTLIPSIVLERRIRSSAPGLPRREVGVLLAWWLLPPSLMATASIMSGTQLFAVHYTLALLPAAAILGGLLLTRLGSDPARAIGVTCTTVLWCVLAHDLPLHFTGWREQSRHFPTLELPRDTPVLFHPQLIEGDSIAWLRDPRRHDYLMTPVLRYPLGDRIVIAPYSLRGENGAYFDELVRGELHEAHEIALAGGAPNLLATWLEQRFPGVYDLREDGPLFVATRSDE